MTARPRIQLNLVGDSGVGKTTLKERMAFGGNPGDPLPDTQPTVGADFVIFSHDCMGKEISVALFDLAGQEQFASIVQNYYTRAQGILIMYDITNAASFHSIRTRWLRDIERYRPPDGHKIQILLIGNKTDRESERAVSKEQAMALAEECVRCGYPTKRIETSCLDWLPTRSAVDIRALLDRLYVAHDLANWTPPPTVTLGRRQNVLGEKAREKNKGCCD
jgi:Ras-related protein Rab-18